MSKKIKSEVIKTPKKSTGTGLVVIPTTPEDLIARAIDKGASIETVERIVALAERVKASQAKEAFDEAMADLQLEMPIIKKNREVKNKQGAILYSYAPLDSIVFQVRPFISKHGFSYQIKTETKEKDVKATAIAKHRLGHSEESSVEVPLGNKTDIMSNSQVTASALTFAKRYAFQDVFGIMTGDSDNDAANTQEPKPITPTPPLAPVKPEKPVKPVSKSEGMKMLREAISKSKDPAQIINLDENVQKSKIYSKTFKIEINKLANTRVNELQDK